MQLSQILSLGGGLMALAAAQGITLTPTTVTRGGPTKTVYIPTTTTETETDTVTVTKISITTTCKKPTPTDCPKLTSTGTACRSCFVPDCTETVQTTKSCGCPAAVPTTTVNFPLQRSGLVRADRLQDAVPDRHGGVLRRERNGREIWQLAFVL
ncbi:hypothetical protein PG997_009630 [Apiospora hydei]|uniref:Uncharacterized protein n=1 Tax=Apiospora hydei TaxID=1337664 RepID=A0ABR1VUW6_9PEZI